MTDCVANLTGQINDLMDEAAQSDDPESFVLVIQVLEAHRDVVIRKLALAAAEHRRREALEALTQPSQQQP